MGRVSLGGIFRENSNILTVTEHRYPGVPSNSAEDGRGMCLVIRAAISAAWKKK